LDKNGDRKLTNEEIKEGIKVFSEAESLLEFLEKADMDKNGYIDYREFYIAAIGGQICMNKDKLAKGFSFLDKSKNGYITAEKLFKY
jgi:Ca2+-binding EF-hand superfamily protein